ncbi:amidase [Aquirufa rosea]|uniref:Amidase n=1 Tax=Aquirufa rosea TaxID=2509241 RepID=A0A4Q1BZT2_9BACT|nr:amidase [Aquirufa rosea]RXK48965.1 amidase [Aquirufa rosea]
MMKYVLSIPLLLLIHLGFAQHTKIQKRDVEGAAKIFDLNFTGAEIDTLLSDVQDNLAVYQEQHRVHLPNSVPLSLWQTVLLPEVHLNKNQQPIYWTKASGIELPMNKSSLAFYSIPQLAELIKTKKISSVQLTQFYIDRIKKYGDTLQCLISLTETIALEQAHQADQEISQGKYRGMLHGIPYGLKDLFAVKGTKTTWGAAPYKEQVIDEDAYVYQKLRAAGAVLVAKFTLGALAMGDYWYGGRTKNPWNLALGSSGSSAGSASATVAGLVPFAIGTETWGSIVSPSTTCGALGLRPTFGRVSRTGAMALSYSLDKIGPICRNAEDAAIVFEAIKGTDGLDLSATEAAFNYSNQLDIKKLRIGYLKNYFDKLKDTTANEWQVLQVLKKLGAKLVPVEFPEKQFYPFQMMDIIIGAECAAQFDELTRFNIDDELTMQRKGDWPNQFRTARFIPAVEYINAQRHRYLLMQQVNYFFKDFDVIISPSLASGNQLAITNLTGHPVVCIPNGFDKKTHKPTSISFLGNLFDEATILALAKMYQDATPWDEMHPEMFK